MEKKNYAGAVVHRFLQGKALKDFVQEYEEHKLSSGGATRRVTDRDLLILHDYQKGAMPNELEKKYKMGRGRLNTSLRIAALSKLS